MQVKFISYPIQEWILDENTQTLGDPAQTLAAIAQDIKFALSTERNKYPIMGSNFGVEFLDLIGKNKGYVRAQIKKRVQDALSIDDRIVSVGEFNFTETENNSLVASFVIQTVIGKVGMNTEVIT